MRPTIFGFMLMSVAGTTFSIAVSSIGMGVAIGLWLILLLLEGKEAFHRTPLDWLFLAYIIAEALATLFSQEQSASLINMKRFFIFSFVYLALVSVDSEAKVRTAFGVIVGVAAVLSLVETFSLTMVGGHFERLSLFQYFLTEGGIKMIMLLLLLPVIIHPGTPRAWRVFSIVAALPLTVGLILTQTRSSWLGFIVGVVVIGVMRSKKVILLLFAVIILFLLFAPADFKERASSIFDPTMTSNLERIHMVQTGWRMFLDRPVFGFGDVDLRKYYVTYTVPLEPAEGGHLHNNIMQLLVTLGSIGFTIVMIIFIRIFLFELKTARSLVQHWLWGSVALGCFAVYIGFHVNGLFEWNFGDHEIAVLLWFTVGLSLVVRNLSNRSQTIAT